MLITDLIKKEDLSSTPTWMSSSKDEKAKLVRKKVSEKEAKEAEALAKELGVWDEFYGGGQAKERQKGKRRGADPEADDSVLRALILKKKEKNMGGFFESLAAKYSEPIPEPSSRTKGKKRNRDVPDDDESINKKQRAVPPPPDIDDEEFAKLQEQLFGGASKASQPAPKAKGRKRK
jgi:DnaJ family protein C protein 9